MSFEMGDQSATSLPYSDGGESGTRREMKGLSVGVAAVFIVGTMCGSGILALPKALVDAGWAGIPLLVICGLLSSYTGSLLGKCWTVLRMRYPQYNHFVADPYPAIAFRAAGKWGERATHVCIVATLFGGATVFLLLIAGNISNLIESLAHFNMAACWWIVIITACLVPLTWLGTPKDFWQAGMIAAATTTVGGILIVIGIAIMDMDVPVYHNNPTFAGFFNAFGTILFAFGGASCFPTIQVDMKKPDKFPFAVVIGIMCVLALYLPVSVTGFVVIGNNMQSSNILDEMTKNGILWAVIILITSHLFMAFLIVINPINQALDLLFHLEDKFSLKRCLVRSGTMLLVLFVALTIPKFGVILSLVGGTTIAATNFIFPPLFYILLSRQRCALDAYGDPPDWGTEEIQDGGDAERPRQQDGDYPTAKQLSDTRRSSSDIPWTQFDIPLHVRVLLIEIILVGVFGGAASTYSVLASLIDGSSGFSVPCYVNWHVADPS